MFEIPEERLPPGFADTVTEPPAEPAEARPAATVVLMRDGEAGPEVLLLRRHRRSGFVPGAWVFPGGRVDAADGDPALLDRCRGLGPNPEPSFWMAALREAFEETGVLLARRPDDEAGDWVPAAASDRTIEALRRTLMDDEATLLDVVARLEARLDARPMVHAAHWVTPVVEPRRYDTHFFVAAVPDGRAARPDPREMVDAVWLTPTAALDRFEAGSLPMVFPTVRTLESLAGHRSTDAVLAAFREQTVERILPRLVRTEAGVGIVIDE
ncbi:MAG: NUDIX domain-containing protein [Longimicrobiales bacterium]|nr:NUDIX domain-containing protein [Longimicrobiales bacterium]